MHLGSTVRVLFVDNDKLHLVCGYKENHFNQGRRMRGRPRLTDREDSVTGRLSLPETARRITVEVRMTLEVRCGSGRILAGHHGGTEGAGGSKVPPRISIGPCGRVESIA